jgi:Uma2 family endonuclease
MSQALNQPTCEIAHLFPAQGEWSEEEYLALDTNWLVEFSDGVVEVLSMPTTSHQMLVLYLYGLLLAHVSPADLGTPLAAPLRVRVAKGKFREPDVVFMLGEHRDRIGEAYWDGADLVMEVVSKEPDDRRRDLETKRREYAQAGIREYWIVDPQEEQISVLKLSGKRYVVHGEYSGNDLAASCVLPGFKVDVGEAFAQRLNAAALKPAKKAKKSRQTD